MLRRALLPIAELGLLDRVFQTVLGNQALDLVAKAAIRWHVLPLLALVLRGHESYRGSRIKGVSDHPPT